MEDLNLLVKLLEEWTRTNDDCPGELRRDLTLLGVRVQACLIKGATFSYSLYIHVIYVCFIFLLSSDGISLCWAFVFRHG